MAEEKRRIKRAEVSDTTRAGTRRAAVKPSTRDSASPSSTHTASSTASTAQQATTGTQVTLEQFIQSYMKQASGRFRQTVWGSNVAKKEMAARTYFGIPAQEKVLLITDSSGMNTCKAGLAFCQAGIYLRDNRGTKGVLPWKDLPKCRLQYGPNALVMANCQFVTADGAELCKLLQEIASRL